MALDIHPKEREGVTILEMKGRVTVGAEAGALRERVGALNTAGIHSLVLNLGGVDYIDSTGLGALVMCATTMRNNNGTVKLLNLTRRSIELLVMTKLATVFEIFSDEQDAVKLLPRHQTAALYVYRTPVRERELGARDFAAIRSILDPRPPEERGNVGSHTQ